MKYGLTYYTLFTCINVSDPDLGLLQVQCGFGRTGSMFAIDGLNEISPDILVMAKGIANGFPLSAIASRQELTNSQVYFMS